MSRVILTNAEANWQQRESPEPKSTRGHSSGRTGVAVTSPSPALPGAALPLPWETVLLGVQPGPSLLLPAAHPNQEEASEGSLLMNEGNSPSTLSPFGQPLCKSLKSSHLRNGAPPSALVPKRCEPSSELRAKRGGRKAGRTLGSLVPGRGHPVATRCPDTSRTAVTKPLPWV